MSADLDAFKVVQSLSGLTQAEKQYLLAVARGEGFYGLGWGSPSQLVIDQSAQFGIDPLAGVGSNNWGADQEQGDATPPTFLHIDHHADGTPYVGHFARYTSPQKSAEKIAAILLKPNVKEAVNAGDMTAAVNAQHANGYFELAPAEYLKAVSKDYTALTKTLGWSPLLNAPPLSGGPASTPPLVSGLPSSGSGVSYSGEPSLHQGMSGSAVTKWQKIIGATPDGSFGPVTLKLTKQWQSLHGLIPDGVVGPKTWQKAKRLAG
jgi:peptidoglycan hydrolase-like protein with peptidoglycan-binding domain